MPRTGSGDPPGAGSASSWPQRLLAGERLALARGISWVENEDERGWGLLRAVYGHTGRAWVVGITGAPGAGKSTLVIALAARLAADGTRVGVVAVDPSSPFSGGAVLGDRVRWTRRIDGDIFFRSLASRGQVGGLSRAAFDVIRLMDAAGRRVVLVETVGAGQAEVDIMRAAHTTVVVAVPGLGDDVQAAKAGILEIGDVFVVNKADRDGADDTARDLRAMLGMSPEARGRREGLTPATAAAPARWFPPVRKVSALRQEGLDALVETLQDHRTFLLATGEFAARGRDEDRLRMEARLKELAWQRVAAQAHDSGAWQTVADQLERRELDPYTAARRLLDGALPAQAGR